MYARKIAAISGAKAVPIKLFGADCRLCFLNIESTLSLNLGNVEYWYDQSQYSNDANQLSASGQPLWDAVEKKIDCDGVGENLWYPITPLASDTQGTWYFKFFDGEGSGQNLLISDAGSTPRVSFALDTANKFYNNFKDVSNRAAVFPTVVPRGGWLTMIHKSNGTSYYAEANGVDLGTPASNNDGNWYDSITVLPSPAAFGRTTFGTAYWDIDYKAAIYVNRETTPAEDIVMRSFLGSL